MIEAYGVKGMKSKPWRKMFKNAEALTRWAEANDATVDGMRDVEEWSPPEELENVGYKGIK